MATSSACGTWWVLFSALSYKGFCCFKKAGIIASISYSDVIFAMIFGLFLGEALPNFTHFVEVL